MMNIYIPIADVTLTDGQTYNGQLPVWATRPLMIVVSPGSIIGGRYPVYIRVTDGGAIKKEITLPYQDVTYLDLSFAAPLLTRADRNNSRGYSGFPQQSVEIWSSNPDNKITLPVFHCDLTYWDTLGVDSALPQPPKPRIPNQTLDIYFPYRINPSDPFQVEVEPVTGAPSDVIFPDTYVLGNTIDIKYVKKLTIKNVWGSGLDQVINYEDKLHTDVIYDESLQCALRARWNMRNGQWFWAAFKDYFWSNKFTPIRGRGGVTEQAEITINLEYGEEWYNVYQELLVSSNVMFELNIPGINQYENKRFRAEVIGDTGARWSNSTKTYRQQVRFRTTELTDNYMFPPALYQPPTPSIVFTAQKNPWTIGAAHAEGLVNNIYSNAAWEVQSTPSWVSADSLTGTAGTAHLVIMVAANAGKERSDNIVLKSKAGADTYVIPIVQAGASSNITVTPSTISAGYINLPVTVAVTSVGNWSVSASDTWITPSAYAGGNGLTEVTLTIADNTADDNAITGTITFYNDLTGQIAVVTVNQTGAPRTIGIVPLKVTVPKTSGEIKTVKYRSVNSWTMSEKPSWVTVTPTSGAKGDGTISITYTANDTGVKRSGYLKIRNTATGEIAICIIEQER